MKVKTVAIIFALFYVGCVTPSFFGVYGLLGAIGRAPLALIGHKSSITYMYDCFSYEIRNHEFAEFWLKRGALAKIPEFQRLYGGQLMSTNVDEGFRLLTEAAASGDYYAAGILADMYEDPKFKLNNPALALKYREMEGELRKH